MEIKKEDKNNAYSFVRMITDEEEAYWHKTTREDLFYTSSKEASINFIANSIQYHKDCILEYVADLRELRLKLKELLK